MNASLSHCSSALYLVELRAPRDTRCLADFDALLPAAAKGAKSIVPQTKTQQLAASALQYISHQEGYLCGGGGWGQALDFSLDFAALVNYGIDCAAHGRLAALLVLGKKTRQDMAPAFGMRDRMQLVSSLKVN